MFLLFFFYCIWFLIFHFTYFLFLHIFCLRILKRFHFFFPLFSSLPLNRLSSSIVPNSLLSKNLSMNKKYCIKKNIYIYLAKFQFLSNFNFLGRTIRAKYRNVICTFFSCILFFLLGRRKKKKEPNFFITGLFDLYRNHSSFSFNKI